jgi:hypothetical protein
MEGTVSQYPILLLLLEPIKPLYSLSLVLANFLTMPFAALLIDAASAC